jgi:hypothetical protein
MGLETSRARSAIVRVFWPHSPENALGDCILSVDSFLRVRTGLRLDSNQIRHGSHDLGDCHFSADILLDTNGFVRTRSLALEELWDG